MIATLSFAALADCGSKSISKNDETTISDTVKQIQKQTEKNTEATAKSTAKNDKTTVSDTVKQTQKQTEKAADVITDAAKESKSAEEVTTEAGSTEAEVSGDAIVATEPANEVAEANEPSYKPATEPQIHRLMNQQILHLQTHLPIFLTTHLLKNLQIIHLLQPSLLLTNMTGYQRTAISSGLQVRQQAKTSMYRVAQ